MTSQDDQVSLNAANQLGPLLLGHWRTQAIYVAAKLGIADLLNDGPKTSEELAGIAGAHQRNLHRVLRFLASIGIFSQSDDGRFEMTPLAQGLRKDVEGSFHGLVMMTGEEWYWRSAGKLLHSVMTDEVAFNHVYKQGMFEYLRQNPEAEYIFQQAMSGITTLMASAVADVYDFSGKASVVDIGGGDGTLINIILDKNPQTAAVLFDLPTIIEKAEPILREKGLLERCQLVGGSFFESIPEGGDIYILKFIIHDWDDEQAIEILKNCRRAISDDKRILIMELIVPEGNEPHLSKQSDLTMMVHPGGLERTEAEFREILALSGFKMNRVLPTESPISIIEAIPV